MCRMGQENSYCLDYGDALSYGFNARTIKQSEFAKGPYFFAVI